MASSAAATVAAVSEVVQRYRTVADGFTTRVVGVGPDGWSVTTPCSDWTVADLVAHVITTHHRVLATLDGADALDVDPKSDLAPQWRTATEAIAEALGDEVRASKIMSGMFGEQTFASLVGRLLCSDTLLHTWVGAKLTVTFASPGQWRGYGSWSDSPPTISNNSILEGGSYASSETKATAVFRAVGTGTATVVALFDATCGSDDSTPCTVPPANFETLTVTVDPV
jgi:hypothetical protein